MKEVYYVYNNEAISSCIFLSVLEKVDNISISRACLILPFLLDDRIVSVLNSIDFDQIDLIQLKKSKPQYFANFNKRYLSLLPVTINSLILLNNSNQISVSEKKVKNLSTISLRETLGDRFNKINKVLPKYLKLIESYSTSELYKTLNIQL